MGKVVEFPRKLEWEPVEAWCAHVPGTQLKAKVEKSASAESYTWYAWSGVALVAMGSASSLEEGKASAKTAFEVNTLVVRTLG